MKIKCEPESKSTSVAGRSLRKTPARASANSAQSLEERRIKNEPQSNDEYDDLNKDLPTDDLNKSMSMAKRPSSSNGMPVPRLSSPSARESMDNKMDIRMDNRMDSRMDDRMVIEECGPFKNHQANKSSNKEKLINFYRNEYHSTYPIQRSEPKSEIRNEYGGGIKEEHMKEHRKEFVNEISPKNAFKPYTVSYPSEDSDEQEDEPEEKSEEESCSSYSPSSSPDSPSDDHLNRNQRQNQIDRQEVSRNATNHSSIQRVHIREMNAQEMDTREKNIREMNAREMNGATNSYVSKPTIPTKPVTVANSPRKVPASNQPTIKSSNQKPKLTISSLKTCTNTDHVRNNLTNLNHLSPTTLKISLKGGRSFATTGLNDSRRQTNFARVNELARSHHQPASNYNQNDEKMSTNEPSASFSESDEESLDNSLESVSDDDVQVIGSRVWRPDFFSDRLEFANQVVITQIRDPHSKSIITFKESRRTFPQFN